MAVCRRGGSTATFQTMNMIFEMLNCPLVTSQYWNVAFGRTPGEAEQDGEGMQTLRNLARNMIYVMKCIWAGRGAGIAPPVSERAVFTNFVRRGE